MSTAEQSEIVRAARAIVRWIRRHPLPTTALALVVATVVFAGVLVHNQKAEIASMEKSAAEAQEIQEMTARIHELRRQGRGEE